MSNSNISIPESLNHKMSITSLKTMESLDYNELLVLDKSLEVEISPELTQRSPGIEEFNFVSQDFAMGEVATTLSRNIVEGDLESILSEDSNCNQDHDHSDGEDDDTESSFNPTADTYKPSLYRRKSTSLLSLFSSKNKKNLTLDTSNSNTSSLTTFTDTPTLSTPSSARSLRFYKAEKEFLSTSSIISVDDFVPLFECDSAKVSSWNGKLWEILRKENLYLTILRSRKSNKAILIIHQDASRNECQLVAKITTGWRCDKSTARDIQIKIPEADILSSVFTERQPLLTIRYTQTDRLLNILDHCRNGNLPAIISNSSTIRTLSSTESSVLSEQTSGTPTHQTDLKQLKSEKDSQVNSLLLLTNVKIKHHVRVDKIWEVNEVGYANIYSQEYKGARVAAKFEILSKVGVNKTSSELIGRLGGIKRLGRTGLYFIDTKGEHQLLEFTNMALADHVYKLVLPEQF